MTKKDKTPKASAAATVQLDFLPPPSPVVTNLKGSLEPSRVIDGQTYVRIADIVNPPDPTMNRYTPEEWAAQLQSYRTLGVKSAVHVRQVEVDGRVAFHLEDGRHRVLGAIELGHDYVKADIDAQGSAATSAMWRFDANARRKADRPIDQAIAWDEMLKAGLNQKQVSDAVGVSQATVSRRLRLLDLPRDLALQVGVTVEEKALEALFALREHEATFQAACAILLDGLTGGRKGEPVEQFDSAYDVYQFVEAGLTDADAKAWDPSKPPRLIREDRLNPDVRNDPDFKKARKGFGVLEIRVPPRWEQDKARTVAYFTETVKVVEIGQAVMDRLTEKQRVADEKAKAKAEKAGKKTKTVKDRVTGEEKVVVVEPKTVEERLPAELVKVQRASVVRHLKAQVSFPDEIIAEALAQYVDDMAYLQQAEDAAAAAEVVGMPLPAADERTGRRPGLALSRSDFLARWKKDRTEALRMLACVLYFRERDPYSKELSDVEGEMHDEENGLVRLATFDAPLHAWLTGTTREALEAVATQAIVDRDAGFKPVVDGAQCDHCDEPARLRKAGVNVCKSEVFEGIDAAALARTRLARKAVADDPNASPEPAVAVAEAMTGAKALKPKKGKGATDPPGVAKARKKMAKA